MKNSVSVFVGLKLKHGTCIYYMLKVNHKPPTDSVQTFCPLPFKRLRVDHVGNINHCCFQAGFLGNILHTDFYDLWKSDLAKEVQTAILAEELHPFCAAWGGCPFIGMENSTHVKPPKHSVHRDLKYPVSLELALPPSHCNIGGESPSDKNPACIMCPRNNEQFRALPDYKLDMVTAVVERVRFLMPYLQELSVLGVAEPFFKGAIFDVLDGLDFVSHRNHIMFWTYTNGTLLHQENVNKFIDLVPTSALNISIDAGTPETYIRIRRQDFYDLIKRNVIAYSKRKPRSHQIKICHNINAINFQEMPLMVREAKEMGARSIHFNFTHTAGGFADIEAYKLNESHQAQYLQIEQSTKNEAKRLKLVLEIYRPFQTAVAHKTLDLVQLTLGEQNA